MRLEVDRRSLAAVSKLLGSTKTNIDKGIAAGLNDAGEYFKAKFTADRLSGRSDSSLGRITGALSRSTYFVVVKPGTPGGDKPGLYFHVGRGAPYAKAHEAPPLGTAGKPITPKKGRFLAIPWKSLIQKRPYEFSSPLQETDLTFVPTRGGATGMLVKAGSKTYKRGKAGQSKTKTWTDIKWLLVRRVVIPPRLNLAKDWAAFQDKLNAIFADRVRAFMKGNK